MVEFLDALWGVMSREIITNIESYRPYDMIYKEDLIKLGFTHPKLAAPDHRYEGADKNETHNNSCLSIWLSEMSVSVTFWEEEYGNGLNPIDFFNKIDNTCHEEMMERIAETKAGEDW